MGLAIVRRVAAGAKVLLGDVSEENLERAADALRFNGYDVETMVVNALDKDQVYAFAARAAELGEVQSMTIVAAGYCLGRGTAKDPRKAIAWAKKAKATGKLDGRGVSVMNEVIEMSEKAL